MKTIDKNYSQATLKEFLNLSSGLKDDKDHRLLLKTLSRIVFNMLWTKHDKSVFSRVFANIGQLTQAVLHNRHESKARYAVFLKGYKNSPVLGKIRTSSIHAEDFNYILYSDGESLFLFLDSESLNVKTSQVHLFDREASGFIPVDNMTLVEFFIQNKIIFN